MAKPKPVAAKKATPKKAAPVKAAKAPTRKVAKKTPAKKRAVKAPAKKAVRVVQAATRPAPPPTEDAAVKTLEQIVPESPIQQADEPEASR